MRRSAELQHFNGSSSNSKFQRHSHRNIIQCERWTWYGFRILDFKTVGSVTTRRELTPWPLPALDGEVRAKGLEGVVKRFLKTSLSRITFIYTMNGKRWNPIWRIKQTSWRTDKECLAAKVFLANQRIRKFHWNTAFFFIRDIVEFALDFFVANESALGPFRWWWIYSSSPSVAVDTFVETFGGSRRSR